MNHNALIRFTVALLIALLAILVIGCAHVPDGPPDPSQAHPACEAFCTQRVKLQCDDNGTGDSPGRDEIEGTADDVPCLDVCIDMVTLGDYRPSRECLETALTCDDTEECIFGDVTAPNVGDRAHRPAHEPRCKNGDLPHYTYAEVTARLRRRDHLRVRW